MHRGLSARSRRVNRCRLLGVSAWAPARHPQADASRAGVAGLLRLAPVGPAVGRGGWPHHVSDDDFAQQKAAQRRRGFLRQTPMANACDKISVAQAGVAAPAAVASYRGHLRTGRACGSTANSTCLPQAGHSNNSVASPSRFARPTGLIQSFMQREQRTAILSHAQKKARQRILFPDQDVVEKNPRRGWPAEMQWSSVKIRGTTGARSRSSSKPSVK